MARRQSVDPLERYTTPGWVVDRLMERLQLPVTVKRWLDPCAGDGALGRRLEGWIGESIAEWDVEPRGMWIEKRDIHSPCDCQFDAAILNPPFSRTCGFVDRCLELAPLVLCLGRLGLLASEERAEWMRARRPSVYVLPNRPSFTPDKGTDRYDYAWYRFERDPGPQRIEWLNSTPKSVRRGEPVVT